jgi:methylated-DNA-protein-cysteine methyltransferase-like protein
MPVWWGREVSRRGSSDRYVRIYRVVRRIPHGRVATYGQVAELADLPGCARQVGYALHALGLSDQDVPWQRVVNAKGEISLRSEPGFEPIQQQLLEAEGVNFDAGGRLDLSQVQWRPRARKKMGEALA